RDGFFVRRTRTVPRGRSEGGTGRDRRADRESSESVRSQASDAGCGTYLESSKYEVRSLKLQSDRWLSQLQTSNFELLTSLRRRRPMRSPRLRAARDRAFRGVDHGGRSVAVHHFALAADLLERVAARFEVREDRTRESIFNLHPRSAAGRAADEKARRL